MRSLLSLVASTLLLSVFGPMLHGDDPPPINPFEAPSETRAESLPGVIELSDGSLHPGKLSLTRDARLRIFETKAQRQREIPLSAVRRIDCAIAREWLEKEWRFKESGSDQKVFTGRSYPAREYVHTITLNDGRTIRGDLSAVVYLQGESPTAERYLLHKRDKGPLGTDLRALLYVRALVLGEKAFAEAKEKAARNDPKNPPKQ